MIGWATDPRPPSSHPRGRNKEPWRLDRSRQAIQDGASPRGELVHLRATGFRCGKRLLSTRSAERWFSDANWNCDWGPPPCWLLQINTHFSALNFFKIYTIICKLLHRSNLRDPTKNRQTLCLNMNLFYYSTTFLFIKFVVPLYRFWWCFTTISRYWK